MPARGHHRLLPHAKCCAPPLPRQFGEVEPVVFARDIVPKTLVLFLKRSSKKACMRRMMKAGLGLAVVALVLALAAMGLGLRGMAVGHASTLQFAEFYQGGGARGLILSDKLVALQGQRVVMAGFMAPPLKPALDFFVLTRVPLALCPFCASDAQWPEDIVFVRLPPGQTLTPTSALLQVVGRLDVGTKTDTATGFVSLVRIDAERVTVLR